MRTARPVLWSRIDLVISKRSKELEVVGGEERDLRLIEYFDPPQIHASTHEDPRCWYEYIFVPSSSSLFLFCRRRVHWWLGW